MSVERPTLLIRVTSWLPEPLGRAVWWLLEPVADAAARWRRRLARRRPRA
jgi:hypothetical protein